MHFGNKVKTMTGVNESNLLYQVNRNHLVFLLPCQFLNKWNK